MYSPRDKEDARSIASQIVIRQSLNSEQHLQSEQETDRALQMMQNLDDMLSAEKLESSFENGSKDYR